MLVCMLTNVCADKFSCFLFIYDRFLFVLLSGVTACFPILAAYICGKQAVPLYDGSWTEYFLKGKPENKILPGDN